MRATRLDFTYTDCPKSNFFSPFQPLSGPPCTKKSLPGKRAPLLLRNQRSTMMYYSSRKRKQFVCRRCVICSVVSDIRVIMRTLRQPSIKYIATSTRERRRESLSQGRTHVCVAYFWTSTYSVHVWLAGNLNVTYRCCVSPMLCCCSSILVVATVAAVVVVVGFGFHGSFLFFGV